MPLSSPTLSSGLQNIGFPSTHADAGNIWAAKYAAYAADAISPMGGAPASLAAAEATLGATLGAAFAAGSPASVISAFVNGLTAFWLAPPVVFAGTPPGAVTLVGGAPALGPALSATFASNIAGKLSKQACSDAIAAVLDTFTRTVIVTHPVVPTPVVGPIS